MEAYTDFAELYDVFMDNVPYDAWVARVKELLAARGIRDGLVLDLCCGTGQVTRRLAAAGYDMIGVDASDRMLDVASGYQALEDAGTGQAAGDSPADRAQAAASGDILYLCQQMQSFELYGTVRAVVCMCDSLNYLTEDGELEQTFRLVNNYLDPEGVFVFDMNTPWKYEALLGDNVFAENRPEGSFIWENEYDPETSLNTYDLTLYARGEGGLYSRSEEFHVERAYGLSQILEALERAGLVLERVYADYDGDALALPAPQDGEGLERWVFVAREKGKKRA